MAVNVIHTMTSKSLTTLVVSAAKKEREITRFSESTQGVFVTPLWNFQITAGFMFIKIISIRNIFIGRQHELNVISGNFWYLAYLSNDISSYADGSTNIALMVSSQKDGSQSWK